MKSYKEVLNKAMNDSGLRKITARESKALKMCILGIYDKIAAICQEQNLCLMLTGGSCLGAVRHNGFIPWDDDLDLMMPRKDYESFIALLESGVMGDNFDFTYPSKEKDSPCLWLQVYRKDTRLITVEGERERFPNGCYVDIFPIEGVPSNNILRKIKGWICNVVRLIANMLLDAETPLTPNLKSFYNSDRNLKRMMLIRRSLGHCFSFVCHKRWVWWYDSIVNSKEIKDYAGIPTGRNLYFKESHPMNVFFPPIDGIFEGRHVKLPAKPDIYLKALYGNYMQIPPVEKRESHFVLDLQIPDYYFSSNRNENFNYS